MTRTIITLDEGAKRWLEDYSHRQHQSMAETVRQAICAYRHRVTVESEGEILRETAGIWRDRQEDGLRYQERLRDEWEERGA